MSDCACDSSGLPIIPQERDLSTGLEVRGIGDLSFEKVLEPGKVVWVGKIEPYTPPVISAIANPIKEVGDTVDFTWTVDITPGRNAIVSKEIDPVPTPAPDMDLPFDVAVTGKKVTSRQDALYHTITVSDGEEEIERALSILFRNKVYLLFTYKDGVTPGQEITDADIALATATLADNIKSVYGGKKTYNIPSVGAQQYIFWIYEAGTTPINSMELSGLPFPLLFIPGSIAIENPHDASISANYSMVRSVNKFGNGSLSLTML